MLSEAVACEASSSVVAGLGSRKPRPCAAGLPPAKRKCPPPSPPARYPPAAAQAAAAKTSATSPASPPAYPPAAPIPPRGGTRPCTRAAYASTAATAATP
jgi:hypothetical protein